MNKKTEKIIRIIGLILIFIISVVIGFFIYNYNVAKIEENSPDTIPVLKGIELKPKKQQAQPKIEQPETEQKPFTRDENDMPKSDLQVPEIG